jgi:ubiquinone/menaquinone biosynthesis C-methylase UbiE
MHMLYHVPDPADALTELRRVLAPGGRLYVVLNAQDHLGELRNAVQQARYEAGLGASPFGERLRLAEGHERRRSLRFSAMTSCPNWCSVVQSLWRPT